MLTTVVVDDERHVRETLVGLLNEYCTDVVVAADASTIADARDAIIRHRPDIVLLDVEMPTGNGFELLGSFERIDFGVIFVTAHDRYALRAIKLSALDYLLKPVDPHELVRAVAKASAHRIAMKPDSAADHAGAEFHERSGSQVDRLAVPTEAGFEFVLLSDVVRCRAEGNYTSIHLIDGRRLVSSRTLGDFDAILTRCGFLRVHHSHIVNLDRVRRYTKGRGGTLVMSDGAEVEVSVRRKEAFLEAIVRL